LTSVSKVGKKLERERKRDREREKEGEKEREGDRGKEKRDMAGFRIICLIDSILGGYPTKSNFLGKNFILQVL